MSGKKIFNKKVNEQDFSINFSGFLKGVYFLNIKTELGQINHKIIKD